MNSVWVVRDITFGIVGVFSSKVKADSYKETQVARDHEKEKALFVHEFRLDIMEETL